MSHRFYSLVMIVLVIALSAIVMAKTPQLISYQAILTDGGGSPVTSTVTVQFTVYDAASAGVILWQETQSITPDAAGAFAASLGSIVPITDQAFSGSGRWLGVRIGADPEMTPRAQVTSSAYAMRVNTLDDAYAGIVKGTMTITESDTAGGSTAGLTVAGPSSNNVIINPSAGTVMSATNTSGGEVFSMSISAGQPQLIVRGPGGDVEVGITSEGMTMYTDNALRGGKALAPIGFITNKGMGYIDAVTAETLSVIDAATGAMRATANFTLNWPAAKDMSKRALGENNLSAGPNLTDGAEFSLFIGENNDINAVRSAVIGKDNLVEGDDAFVVGTGNTVVFDPSAGSGDGSVTFGLNNVNKGDNSFIFGTGNAVGTSNSTAFGVNNVTNGGNANMIFGSNNSMGSTGNSSITGGDGNHIVGSAVTHVGGGQNDSIIYAGWSVLLGGKNNLISGGTDAGSEVTNRFNVLVGGQTNTVGDNNNIVDVHNAIVVGGSNNVASAPFAIVVGGTACDATGLGSIVGGGGQNEANGDYSVAVGGGDGNFPNRNIANGDYSFIGGGIRNETNGNYAMAAGRRAKADSTGSFVWADSVDVDFRTTAPNQFLIRAGNGVGINTNSPTQALEVAGTIYSTSGGFKFPDGSLQSSAASAITDGWTDDGGVVRLSSASDNVGIGSASPTAKLGVDGDIKATGTITAGSATAKGAGAITMDPTLGRISSASGILDFGGNGLETDGYMTCGTGVWPRFKILPDMILAIDSTPLGPESTICLYPASGQTSFINSGFQVKENLICGPTDGAGPLIDFDPLLGTADVFGDFTCGSTGNPIFKIVPDSEEVFGLNAAGNRTFSFDLTNNVAQFGGMVGYYPDPEVVGPFDPFNPFNPWNPYDTGGTNPIVTIGYDSIPFFISGQVGGFESPFFVRDNGAIRSGGMNMMPVHPDIADPILDIFDAFDVVRTRIKGGLIQVNNSGGATKVQLSGSDGLITATSLDLGGLLLDNSTMIMDTTGTGGPFSMLAASGFDVYSNSTMTSGVTLAPGGGAFGSVSDRNMKENFEQIDVQSTLEKVAALPMTTWNYKSQDESIRHIGPMAQDFYAAFSVGEDDRHITTIDADGVALAAIQGLYQQIQELKKENAKLTTQLSNVQSTNDSKVVDMQSQLSRLTALVEKMIADNSDNDITLARK